MSRNKDVVLVLEKIRVLTNTLTNLNNSLASLATDQIRVDIISGAVGADIVNLRNVANVTINPATEDSLRGGLPAALSGLGNLQVAIVEGAAGGGIAQLQVRNVANAWTDIGYFAGNLNVPIDIIANTIGLATQATLALVATEVTAAAILVDTGVIAADTTSLDTKITVEDFDTAVPVDNRQIVGIALPSALGAVIGGTAADPIVTNVSDRAARLLGVIYGSQAQQLLQRGATFDLQVQLRSAGAEIDPRARTWTLGAGDVPDLSDRAARLLGVVYGSQAQQLLQRAVSFDLLVQLRSGAAEIDPRDTIDRAARLLGVIYGSQAQQLLQRAVTFELLVQLRSGGAEIDPRAIRALAKVTDEIYVVLRTDAAAAYDARDTSDRAARLLGLIYGSQNQQLQQRAASFELLVQLTSAGAQIDPRDVSDRAARDLGKVDIAAFDVAVDVSDRAARLLGVVYGSQSQQLLQRGATFDLQVQLRTAGAEYDARDISDRAARDLGKVDIAAFDVAVDVSDRAARDCGKIDIAGFDGSLPAGTNLLGKVDIEFPVVVTVNEVHALTTDSGVAISASARYVLVVNITDTDDIECKIDSTATFRTIPEGLKTASWPIVVGTTGVYIKSTNGIAQECEVWDVG